MRTFPASLGWFHPRAVFAVVRKNFVELGQADLLFRYQGRQFPGINRRAARCLSKGGATVLGSPSQVGPGDNPFCRQCDLSHAKTRYRLFVKFFMFLSAVSRLLVERHKQSRSGACFSPSPVCRRDRGKSMRRSMQQFDFRRLASGAPYSLH